MRTAIALSLVLTAVLAGCADEETGGDRPQWTEDEVPKAPAASSPAPTEAPPAAPTPVTVETKDDTSASSKADDSKPDDKDDDAGPKTNPVNTCQTAHDLGGIAGDDGEATLSVQGNCTEWLRVRFQEKKTTPFSNPMKGRFTLVSPSAKDFDLFVYMDQESDKVECTTATTKSDEPGSRTDTAVIEWGESYTANSSDDSRTVNILVKTKDGSCDAAKSWSLVIQGNK